MANDRDKELRQKREQEIEEIGEEDSRRLHEGMNKSDSSEDKRANKQPDHTPDKGKGHPDLEK